MGIGIGVRGTALLFVVLGLATAGPARAADKVVVASQLAAGNSASPTLLVGVGKGLFASEGIDVELVDAETNATAAAALLSGNADIVVSALSAGFFNVAYNGDLVLLAADSYTGHGFGGGSLIASNAAYAKGLTSPSALAGRRMGIASAGNSSEYTLYQITQKYHVPFSSLTLVTVGSGANLAAGVKGGSIDAAGSPLSVTVPMEQNGDGKIIERSVDDNLVTLNSAVFTSRKVLAAKRDVLVRFMKGYLTAAALYGDTFEHGNGPKDVARTPQANELLDIIAKTFKEPDDAILQGLSYVPPKGDLDMGEVTNQLTLWQQLGLADAKIQAPGLVDLSVLTAAQHP